MKFQRFSLRFAILVLLAGQCACTAIRGDAITLETSASAMKPVSVDELIGDYKHWTRVNPVPALFHSFVATQCADIRGQMKMEEGNPHRDKFITVYVNQAGRKAMMEERFPRFPQGSVIVKEKLPSIDSTSPELLTVMIKREAGFNPDNGDWEYVALDGAGKQVQARGRLEKCQACHTMVKDTDFVYRQYLPKESWEKLR